MKLKCKFLNCKKKLARHDFIVAVQQNTSAVTICIISLLYSEIVTVRFVTVFFFISGYHALNQIIKKYQNIYIDGMGLMGSFVFHISYDRK